MSRYKKTSSGKAKRSDTYTPILLGSIGLTIVIAGFKFYLLLDQITRYVLNRVCRVHFVELIKQFTDRSLVLALILTCHTIKSRRLFHAAYYFKYHIFGIIIRSPGSCSTASDP